MTFRSALAVLREDLDAAIARDPATTSRVEMALASPGLHAIWAHRVAHRLWQRPGTKLFARLLSRALMKFGTAIANRIPIMSTTIMISTRVKPRRTRFTSLDIIDFLPPVSEDNRSPK